MTEIKNKSVLLVAWFFYPKLGGAEMIVLNQARYLKDKGYSVSVLTSSVPDLSQDEKFEGINIYRRDFMNSSVSFSETDIISQLEKIFGYTKPKIVHFHNGSYPAASSDMNAGAQNIKVIFKFAKIRDCKIVEHSHNAQLKDPVATKQLRDLPWDTVVCVSQFVKDKWQEFGSNAKDLVVIYNGVNLKQFKQVEPEKTISKIRQEKTEKLIFFPARIVSMAKGGVSKQKNFQLVLKACKKLLNEGINNFRLIAILNQSEKEINTNQAYRELNQLLGDYDLGTRMIFIKSLSPDEMPKAYAAVDIICVPSISETFGLVYLEAMASGKIAIASNTGGPKEYIKNDINGFIVDPENDKDLALVLKECLSDSALEKRISQEGLKTANFFSLDLMMKKIEAIYRKLLEEK